MQSPNVGPGGADFGKRGAMRPRWMKKIHGGSKAHYMEWFSMCSYWQPICHQSDDSNFYGSAIVTPSEHNKCKACLRKLEGK